MVRIKPTPRLDGRVVGIAVVARCQPSTGERVEGVESHVVFAQAGQEFEFDGAVEGVVYALVDGGEGVGTGGAEFAYCCDYVVCQQLALMEEIWGSKIGVKEKEGHWG